MDQSIGTFDMMKASQSLKTTVETPILTHVKPGLQSNILKENPSIWPKRIRLIFAFRIVVLTCRAGLG